VKIATLLLFYLSISSSAVAQPARDVCAMALGIRTDGTTYELNLMNMPPVRRSLKVIAQEARGGCYNDANPSAITSVTLYVEKGTTELKLHPLLNLLSAAGWQREKIHVEQWHHPPARPDIVSRD